MSDKQSIEDLAGEIMSIAKRTDRGIWAVNAKEQILELLQSWQSTRVTQEWIQEKTVELIEIISKGRILGAMSFIRKLVKEIEELRWRTK